MDQLQTIWGCMSSAGVGQLVISEGILNAGGYINILYGHLQISVQKLGIAELPVPARQ